MGTNYYLVPEPCPNPCAHCSGGERLHIGKSSHGWEFNFRGHKDRGISSYRDWIEVIERIIERGGEIQDEYGRKTTIEEFQSMVAAKLGGISSARLALHQLKTDADYDYFKRWQQDEIHHGSGTNQRLNEWLDPEGYGFCGTEFS